ncbi:hypothetical protein [Limibacillus sp. MBR-115]|jgi:hypothetical protein|uniref:hypothetical protein n=1 Tax=Limibacillus sp. MBR-115 TaxID=3156465 RepID=UPI0033936D19
MRNPTLSAAAVLILICFFPIATVAANPSKKWETVERHFFAAHAPYGDYISKWDPDWIEHHLEVNLAAVGRNKVDEIISQVASLPNLGSLSLTVERIYNDWGALVEDDVIRSYSMIVSSEIKVARLSENDMIWLDEYLEANKSVKRATRPVHQDGCEAVIRVSDETTKYLIPPGFIGKGLVFYYGPRASITEEDCYARGLLVALGLSPEILFADIRHPLSKEELNEALSALDLLYHPSLKHGMTRDEVLQVLTVEGLLDPLK